MWNPRSEKRRRWLGTLEVLACVALSASVGFAAVAVRPRPVLEPVPAALDARPAREVRSEEESCRPRSGVDGTMLRVPAGTYRSFFKRGGKAIETPVAAFQLDRAPVTRSAFAEFVKESPAWRRSRVRRLFAEEGYLRDFASDTDAGLANPDAPVTFVSWFAARAYCECQGKRLATLAEWERAATPDGGESEPKASVKGKRFGFAMGESAAAPGGPSFGSVWEWIEDFDGALVSGRTTDTAESNLFCGAGVRAADASDYGGFLRYSFRSSLRAAYTLKNLGFRCAGDAP
jgi:formylglycine-generating enzyme required for sulfatase activity